MRLRRHTTTTLSLRGRGFFGPRALPLPGSGTSAAPAPRSVRAMPPRGGPRPDTGRTRHSRSTGPGCRVKALRAEEREGRDRTDHGPAAQPGGSHAHTTKHAPPTPGQAAEPEPVVTGCLYEAGFHATGPHPQGGVAIARSIDEARQRLADMLIFCDPTAAATADITAVIPTHTVARYSRTVAELFADFNTGTRDHTVHAHPLTVLAAPTDGRR